MSTPEPGTPDPAAGASGDATEGTVPRATPLRAVHEGLGATMTAFAGWLMPLRYRSETAEHQAVRNAAGLFDLSHMGEIAVTGPARPRRSISPWSATCPRWRLAGLVTP